MPVYEYRCNDCRRRISLFWRTFSEAQNRTPVCSHCGSTNLIRLVSRVRVVRSEESRLESLADDAFFSDFDEKDPRSLARMMRRMADEVGEDLGPEFEEVVGRLEAGESPEEIEKAMPELMGEEGGAGDIGEEL
ncbi:MAG: FmdB family zinc ribbon protein [Anaerolineae bacterium]|nr:zinc ribbon domain-containing protein [Anaerolineae bacterium]MDW8068253.1 FmdB family zinc ribbon protein [Anaerolineae bacterium]